MVFKCPEQSLLKLVIKLPSFISPNQSGNLASVPEVNAKLQAKLINVGLWGLLPLVIGILLMIILFIYLCFAKGSKKFTKLKLGLSISSFVVVGIIFIAAALSVPDIGKQFNRIEQAYVSFHKEFDLFKDSMVNTSNKFDSTISGIRKDVLTVKKSKNYTDIIQFTGDDFLVDVLQTLDDQTNPISDFVENFNSVDLAEYEDYRITIHNYINKTINPVLIAIYAIAAGMASLIAVSILKKVGKLLKISFGLVIFLVLIFLLLSIIFMALPMILSIFCPQVKSIVRDMNISYIGDIIDCNPNKQNPILTEVINTNMGQVPELNGSCRQGLILVGLYNTCLDLQDNLRVVRKSAIYNLNATQKSLIYSLSIIFQCDKMPRNIEETKCLVCSPFAKSLFQVGLVSSLGSILFLLFGFQLPSLSKRCKNNNNNNDNTL